MTTRNALGTGSPIPVSAGGTSAATADGAFNNIAPTNTKGDLIVNNGSDNVRLPIGTDTYVLTADSGSADGLKWAVASAGSGTVTSVAVTGSTGLVIGGSPITTSGTITATLGTELQGLAGLASTGLVVRTGAGTYVERTITGTASDISVSNGDGVSGNPTLDLISTAVTPGSYTYSSLTVDAKGRITAASSGSAPVSGVTSLTGTANEVTVSASTGAVTLSVPSAFIAPGSIAATTTVSGTTFNSSTLTASEAVFSDISNNLVSVAVTGSGNVVLASSPTLITPALGTPASGVLTNCTGLPVAGGGTGVASTTAYSLLAGGTTSTGALQSLASLGTSGQVLVSAGAGALPTWQTGAETIVNANTSSYTLAPGSVYMCNHGATLITFTLPTTAAVGDKYEIIQASSVANGGWKVAQNAGQSIQVFSNGSSNVTTAGTGGSITNESFSSCVTIRCVVANTTFTTVYASGVLNYV